MNCSGGNDALLRILNTKKGRPEGGLFHAEKHPEASAAQIEVALDLALLVGRL